MTEYAVNPANGYREPISKFSWLWCLIFGGFYFAFKGVWKHFIIGIILASITFGVSWLIYPFFAKSILIRSYGERGWKLGDDLINDPLHADFSKNEASDLESASAIKLLLILSAVVMWKEIWPFLHATFLYTFEINGVNNAVLEYLYGWLIFPAIIGRFVPHEYGLSLSYWALPAQIITISLHGAILFVATRLKVKNITTLGILPKK